MQRFRKTKQSDRFNYRYYDQNGNIIQTLRPGQDGVTAEDIKQLHALDDAEVYNNIKNSKPSISLSSDQDTEKQTAWNVSFDQFVSEEESEETFSLAEHDLLSRELEVNEQLHEALEQLNPEQKHLVQKIFFENQTLSELAKEKDVSVAAIHYRLKVIYKKISKKIEG